MLAANFLPRPLVMLVVDEELTPFAAIGRAMRQARTLGADLLVLGVVAPGERSEQRARARLTRLMSRFDILVAPASVDIRVRVGSLVGLAIEVGKAARPSLVVLAPEAGGDGSVAVEISRILRAPVLVARGARRGGIVIATDMTDPRYPVLSACRPLLREAQKRATFVHNAPPAVVMAAPLEAWRSHVTATWLADITADAKLTRLRELASDAGDGVDAVVMRSKRTIDAILEVATECNADVVAVGHSSGSRLGEALGTRTSEQIVDRCRGSVLVIPFQRDVPVAA